MAQVKRDLDKEIAESRRRSRKTFSTIIPFVKGNGLKKEGADTILKKVNEGINGTIRKKSQIRGENGEVR